MKEITLVLKDEALSAAVEAQAAASSRSVEEIVVDALQQWLADARLDVQERSEIEEARKDWQEKGGVDARDFFNDLRDEAVGE